MNQPYSLYDSYAPTKYKLGMLNVLLYKACKISNNYNQFDEELNKMRYKFHKQCYPQFILDKMC